MRLNIDAEEYKVIKHLAIEKGLTIHALVTDALRVFVDKNRIKNKK